MISWKEWASPALKIAIAVFFVMLTILAAIYVPSYVTHDAGTIDYKDYGRTDFITIVLSALSAILAALGIVLAVLGAVGFVAIKSAAKKTARKIAKQEAARVAEEVATRVATAYNAQTGLDDSSPMNDDAGSIAAAER